MPPIAFRLSRSGLLLFFVGLPLGFLVHHLPNERIALSAHLNAVQSGTALAVIGLIWPHLRVPERWTRALALALSLSFWGLEAGLVVAALVPASGGGGARAGLLSGIAGILGGASALTMLVAVGAAYLAMRAPAERPATMFLGQAASDGT